MSPTKRDARKRDTAQALADAAYEIVRRDGFDALTAEAVANAAGVSRRTFFNYYPSVDSALQGAVADFFDWLTEQLQASPPDEPLDALLDRMTGVPADGIQLERVCVMALAAQQSPALSGLLHDHMNTWSEWLEGFLRARLPAESGTVFSASLAASVLGVAMSLTTLWATRHVGDVTAEALAEHQRMLREGLGFVKNGFCSPPILGEPPAVPQAKGSTT